MKNWKHPKTKTGDAVTGENYLRRDKINDYFWSFINKGSDVLFVAPRRVGKTSIMKDLASNAPENTYCIYDDVEGVASRNMFYKRIFYMLIERLSSVNKAKKLFSKWSRKYNIRSIGISKVEIEKEIENYYNEVTDLLKEVAKENLTVILFIDEFVEVLLNLKKMNKTDDARNILHELREIRHNDNFKNIIFVYAGSIGLHNIVKEIGRPKLINDIEPFRIKPLTEDEAFKLIQQLTKSATITYSSILQKYLTDKIEYLLPYFVQLMIQEVDRIAYDREIFDNDKSIIETAYINVIKNTSNFADWTKRLKDYSGKNYSFIDLILTCIAHKNQLTIQEIYDIAVKQKKTEDYKDLIDELVKDGYLIENENVYTFLSPFIKDYWLHKNPISSC
ncbi:MAG: AAA family ATPase [Chlorobi bacterium]|nr:AAA family ATPase [Chlorobiota bacterium]